MSQYRTYGLVLKAWLLTCWLLANGGTAHAQSAAAVREGVITAKSDTQRVSRLLDAGNYYMLKPGEEKADLDSAFYFLERARQLAIRTGYHEKYMWSLYNIGNLWIEMKLPWRAAQLAPSLTTEQEASLYANLCYYYTFKPGEHHYDLDTAIMYGKKSISIGKREKLTAITEDSYQAVAAAYIEGKQLASAVALLPEIPDDNRVQLLHRISYDYMTRNYGRTPRDLDSAIIYAWQSIHLGRKRNDPELEHRSFYVLAYTDIHRGQHTHAKQYIPHLKTTYKGDICMILANWHLNPPFNADSARHYANMAAAAFNAAGNKKGVTRANDLVKAANIVLSTPSRMPASISAAERFRKLTEMGKQYQSGFPAFDLNQLSIAANYLNSALRIADSLRQDTMRIEAWKELSKTHYMMGDTEKGRQYIDHVLAHYQQARNIRMLAYTWVYHANIIRRQRPNYSLIAAAYGKSREYYAAVGDKENEIQTGVEEASYLREDARPDEARALLLALSEKYAGMHPSAYKISRHLAFLAQLRGDMSAALQYAMTGLQQAEHACDTADAKIFLTRLADIYYDLGQHENSIDTYRKVYKNAHNRGVNFDYYAVFALTESLIRHQSPAEALAFVQQVYREHPPTSFYPERLLQGAIAMCYNALGQSDLAEKNFLASIENIDNLRVGDKLYTLLHFNTGKFFLLQKKYTVAAEHLRKAIRFRPDIASVALTNNAHYMLFQCDSALGNFRQAIGHYQLFKYYNDSLFNVSKSRQISELQIQYATEKKDQSLLAQLQEIKLRNQSIQILKRDSLLQQTRLQQAALEQVQITREAERKDQDLLLKEKSMQVLKKQSQNKVSQLKRERLISNVYFGGAALLLVIIALLINGYRLKQKHNRSLKVKQVEIGQKNTSLEKLLTEKEWLLKEIHHRVKNNLQIVMSLLNSQSAYLQNDAALGAIRDSQHRVQAISLIHKKLYQSDNVGVIHMPHYIHELTDYLLDCFGAGRRIRLQLNIAPIKLDVSQAVPLGLILNEAITNAIKYAFPDNAEGIIHITLEQETGGHYTLTIADNGKGLPPDFDPGQSRSLGMSLMEGLSNDLGGQFSIHSRQGTVIHIRFTEDTFAHPVLSIHQENIAV